MVRARRDPGGLFPSGNITCGGQTCGSATYFEPGASDDPIIFPALLDGAMGLVKDVATTGAAIIGDIFGRDAAEEGGSFAIGKLDDLRAPGALKPGESELPVPNQPGMPPQDNWAANSSVLRKIMNAGKPIRDVSLDAEGNPAKNTGFLRAERNLLENHGWTLHSDGYWHPPQR